MLKCLLEDLKKDFFSTLDSFSYLEKSSKSAFNEKFTIKAFTEINIEEYQAGLKLPEVLRKKLEVKNIEDAGEKKEILQCLEAILKEKEERRLFEKYEVQEEFVREIFGLVNSDDHSIYLKIEAEIKKRIEVTVFLKIPADYPYE